jgi:hypothetical protein
VIYLLTLVLKHATKSYIRPLTIIGNEHKIEQLITYKMRKKLKKKEYLKIVLFVTILIAASKVFTDWEHFKEGLFGF